MSPACMPKEGERFDWLHVVDEGHQREGGRTAGPGATDPETDEDADQHEGERFTRRTAAATQRLSTGGYSPNLMYLRILRRGLRLVQTSAGSSRLPGGEPELGWVFLSARARILGRERIAHAFTMASGSRRQHVARKQLRRRAQGHDRRARGWARSFVDGQLLQPRLCRARSDDSHQPRSMKAAGT